MKKFKTVMGMVAIAVTLLTVTSCKDTKKSDEQMEMNHDGDENMDMDQNVMQNGEMMNMEGNQKTSKPTAILVNYLELKNALVADDSEKAASIGKHLYKVLGEFGRSTVAESQKQEVDDIIEDAREHAEHIAENNGKIEHQREHFEIISKDVEDLIAIVGTDRVLYKTFCPMYNEGKGAIWLSETKEIKNPYLGSKMLTCGEVQEEIK